MSAGSTTIVISQNNATAVINRNAGADQVGSATLISPMFLFMAGGMGLAAGLGWAQDTYTRHFLFSWFIGVAVGAIIASLLINMLLQRMLALISVLLELAAGIIFIAGPYSIGALLAARYIGGFGIGLAVVPFIVHTSEISTPKTRAMFLTFEQYAVALGFLIQVYFDVLYVGLEDGFSLHRIHGILVLLFSFFALIGILIVRESPVFYLRRGDDAAAMECLRRLRAQFGPNEAAVQTNLAILKDYIAQNEREDFRSSCSKGLLPLVKMMLYRGTLAFTIALPLNIALEVATLIGVGTSASSVNWPALVYGALHLIGAVITMIMMHYRGIKAIGLFSLLIMAAFAISVGAIFKSPISMTDSSEMLNVCILLMIYQLFAGMYAPTTTVYLGEAFPLQVKPYFIAICICVEQVVHIIVIATFQFGTIYNTTFYLENYSFYAFGIAVGVIMLALYLVFCVTMPETRRTTLLEAQRRFRRLLNTTFS